MQRIRTVKPDFFTDYKLFQAEHETGLPLRIGFIGLFTCADREGRFKWDVIRLKLKIMPFDSLDFEQILDSLAKYKFVIKYTVDQKTYGYIPTWHEHQNIPAKEAESRIPSA